MKHLRRLFMGTIGIVGVLTFLSVIILGLVGIANGYAYFHGETLEGIQVLSVICTPVAFLGVAYCIGCDIEREDKEVEKAL